MKPMAIRAVWAGFLLEIENPAVAIPQFIQFVRKPGRE